MVSPARRASSSHTAAGEEFRAESGAFVEAYFPLHFVATADHLKCRDGVGFRHGFDDKLLFGIVLQGFPRIGRSTETRDIKFLVLHERFDDRVKGFGQQAGVIVGIHHQIRRRFVKREVAVGRESLSFVNVERHVGA